MSRFTHSATVADAELEARIRATLRRHAEDIEPHQPLWSELVAQAGAVVLPLHGAELAPAHLRSTGRRPHLAGPWVRPTLAAAVALTIALSAAVVIQGRVGDDPTAPGSRGDDEIAVLDPPGGQPLPVPGDGFYLPETAVSFALAKVVDRPVASDDPTILGEEYVRSTGLYELEAAGYEVQSGPAQPFIAQTPSGTVEVATYWWSVWRGPGDGVTNGGLFLRRNDPVADNGQWTVVGAYTASGAVVLADVRRAEGLVSFVVMDNMPNPDVKVRVSGALVERKPKFDEVGTADYVLPDPAPGEVIIIEMQHLVDGLPISVTAMALAPAGEQPPATAPTSTQMLPND